MRLTLSKISTVAVLGLVGAAAPAASAQAQEQWTPPALELTASTCNTDGEWELTWSLTDTTDTVNTPDEYTYTVAEVTTQIGGEFGPWENAVLDGDLQVGAVLPKTGAGSLTGIQTVPGDTERVKLKAQSDRAVPITDGRKKEGRGLKNSLQHAVELGDCSLPAPQLPTPEELPETDFGVGIVIADDVLPEPQDPDADAEWVVDFSVPEGAPVDSVEFSIAADTGPDTDTVESGDVGVGDSTFTIAVDAPVEEPEEVALELTVGGSEPLFIEEQLPVVDAVSDDPAASGDPTGDPTGDPIADPAADPAASGAGDDPALPTLPTTGVPVAVIVGVAAVLITTGVLAVQRRKERNGTALPTGETPRFISRSRE